ncbi:MAG: methylenetetrahydrofolate reductase [NAD(P)H] [Proteobacteria bacterium]|nr:methylenetetrahydrofolate reductase [NAD(P)H] [Pseudomonadota bacterium]
MSLPFILPKDVDFNVSFEFFPPRTEKMEKILWESVELLSPLNPNFVSVTYGAGGLTRDRTHEIVKKLNTERDLNVAAHLTCVGASRGEIDDIARKYWDDGIRHIVALRGDLPEGHDHASDGYDHANDLVEGLKKIADFEISVAGYPEKHPEAVSPQEDLDNLKRKVDAGADRVITQFFVEPMIFLDFCDKAKSAGIDVPIIPGMFPVTNFERTVDFAKMCGATIPEWMHNLFSGLDSQPETRHLVAEVIAAEQCKVLHDNGVKDFHFYTLNRSDLVLAICHILGLRAG